MTEYEIASLFTQISDNLGTQLTNFLTIASLYLGAGFLASHRLSLQSAITFTGIFLVVNLALIVVMFNTVRSWMGIAKEIRGFADQGKGLAWHQATTMPAWVQASMPASTVILFAIVVIGAVYFFFSSRRQNLKLQALASP